MRHFAITRFEAGLMVMVTVLFLYAPANENQGAEKTEYRFRTVELVQEFADWVGNTFQAKQ